MFGFVEILVNHLAGLLPVCGDKSFQFIVINRPQNSAFSPAT
jgi:hypothetical protein